ncbi:MAG: crossover junction endodeoxyribonuclease RuvC [Clostridia bacterium]|nr:crossover junction endodeoxyribonuclease RuvC [Clostridia bacterium]
MTVLGIDPGLATMGYGTVVREGSRFTPADFGVAETAAGDALPARLSLLYTRVCGLLAEFKPDAVAVEELFFSRNTKTAIAVAQARGVVLLAAETAGVPLYEYTPMQVKRAVTGNGHAEKKQVQWMIQRMLGLAEPPKPDDAADALAIAVCHLQVGALASEYRIK